MSKSHAARLTRLEKTIQPAGPSPARMFVACQDLDDDNLFSTHEVHPELVDRLNVPEEPDVTMTAAELDELAAQGHTIIRVIYDSTPIPNWSKAA